MLFCPSPIAQWKSVPFTPERSLVRTQLGLPFKTPVDASYKNGAAGVLLCDLNYIRPSRELFWTTIRQ